MNAKRNKTTVLVLNIIVACLAVYTILFHWSLGISIAVIASVLVAGLVLILLLDVMTVLGRKLALATGYDSTLAVHYVRTLLVLFIMFGFMYVGTAHIFPTESNGGNLTVLLVCVLVFPWMIKTLLISDPEPLFFTHNRG